MVGEKILVKQSCSIIDIRGKWCVIIKQRLVDNYVGIRDEFGTVWYIKEYDFDIEYIKKLELL